MDFVKSIANDLSSDQKYLFEISQAISKGSCSIQLAKKKPGTINHARWLTLANNILREYMATEKPSENLNLLVEFIIKVIKC